MELNLCPACHAFVGSDWLTCRACDQTLQAEPVAEAPTPEIEPEPEWAFETDTQAEGDAGTAPETLAQITSFELPEASAEDPPAEAELAWDGDAPEPEWAFETEPEQPVAQTPSNAPSWPAPIPSAPWLDSDANPAPAPTTAPAPTPTPAPANTQALPAHQTVSEAPVANAVATVGDAPWEAPGQSTAESRFLRPGANADPDQFTAGAMASGPLFPAPAATTSTTKKLDPSMPVGGVLILAIIGGFGLMLSFLAMLFGGTETPQLPKEVATSVVTAAPTTTTTSRPPGQWVDYVDPENRFQISVPTPPRVDKEEVNGQPGVLVQSDTEDKYASVFLRLTSPPPGTDWSKSDQVLKTAAQETATKHGMKLRSSPIETNEGRRELNAWMTSSTARLDGKYFVQNGKLYAIYVVTNDTDGNSQMFTKVTESFSATASSD